MYKLKKFFYNPKTKLFSEVLAAGVAINFDDKLHNSNLKFLGTLRLKLERNFFQKFKCHITSTFSFNCMFE